VQNTEAEQEKPNTSV